MECLVYLPHSYTGRGPAESCIRIIEQFPDHGIAVTVFVHRAKAPIAPSVRVVEAGGGVMRKLPFRVVAPVTGRRLEWLFRKAVDASAPGTLAYFWPDSPIDLVRHAKSRGLVCVREMINNPLARAKPILDAAYKAAGLPPTHGITEGRVAEENAELALHDLVFSSNAELDASLSALGIPAERVLPTTFGWTRGRFKGGAGAIQRADGPPFRAVFVGLMNVRKGIPVLLDAWKRAGLHGELVLAGTPEDVLKPMIAEACGRPDIRHLGHVSDVEALYRSSDVFVFPTHEEGGPQVTYEAAACGIPIITTPMGAARLIREGETGLLVGEGDSEALAQALQRIAGDRALGTRLAAEALAQVGAFEYAAVGRQRAMLLRQALG